MQSSRSSVVHVPHPTPAPMGLVDTGRASVPYCDDSDYGRLHSRSNSLELEDGDHGMMTTTSPIRGSRGFQQQQQQQALLARMSAVLKLPTQRLRGPIYYGWLWKKGASFKTWKKRFFLLNGCTLTYYTQPSVVETEHFGPKCLDMPATGGLRVAGADLTDETNFGILVTSSSGRVLHIQAGDEVTRLQWLTVLQEAPMKKYGGGAIRCTSVSDVPGFNALASGNFLNTNDSTSMQSSMSSDEGDTGDAEMQGWLHVRGALGYKRRYVMLVEGHVTITTNSRARRREDIRHEVISVAKWPGHEFGLFVQLDRHKELYAHASSTEEQQAWIEALMDAM